MPDSLSTVEVGSLVRVPLGGRRVRGYVTHIRPGDERRELKDIIGVVGELPVFSPRLLETLRWASIHYVAPVASLLGRSGPPNSPRRIDSEPMTTSHAPDQPATKLATALGEGRRVRAQYLLGGRSWAETVASLATAVLERRRNAAVIMPTVAEAEALTAQLVSLGLQPHVVTSSVSAAKRTRAWVAAEIAAGQLLVGTRELASWKLGALGLALIVEEGRPAMKSPQTPTVGVQTLLRRRANAESFQLALAGPTPTTEALAAGVEVVPAVRRPWGLVEVVDRSEEPPGGGLLLDSTVHAIRGVARRGGSVFVFVARRGDAVAFRCVACGELRRCAQCDAAASRHSRCQRCDAVLGPCVYCSGERFQPLGAAMGTVLAELRRRIGDVVTQVGDGGTVEVGTERDLPAVGERDLSVVVDADGPLLAPHYRAEEDALRTFARVALTVARGRGRRCLFQTLQPQHAVFAALRSADPVPALRSMLDGRARDGFPPVGQLVAVEVAEPPPSAGETLEAIAGGCELLGPAQVAGRSRWLVSGHDLRSFKVRLRNVVQEWRNDGARVRIDADPIRL